MLNYILDAVPVRSISAFNRLGQRSIVGVLKGYFDGSGKVHDPSCRFVTLAGVYADDSTWEAIEGQWAEVCSKYEAPYSHMRELLGGLGPFENWDESQKTEFVRELFMCVAAQDKSRFVASSITVDLEAYVHLRSDRTNVKPVEAVCIDYCLTDAFSHPEFKKGRAELLFDRSETFLKFAEFVWSREKSQASSWASYVTTLAPVEMKEVAPVQIADLLAWSENRHQSGEFGGFWGTLNIRAFFSMSPYFHILYKRDELMKHPGFFSWRSTV